MRLSEVVQICAKTSRVVPNWPLRARKCSEPSPSVPNEGPRPPQAPAAAALRGRGRGGGGRAELRRRGRAPEHWRQTERELHRLLTRQGLARAARVSTCVRASEHSSHLLADAAMWGCEPYGAVAQACRIKSASGGTRGAPASPSWRYGGCAEKRGSRRAPGRCARGDQPAGHLANKGAPRRPRWGASRGPAGAWAPADLANLAATTAMHSTFTLQPLEPHEHVHLGRVPGATLCR